MFELTIGDLIDIVASGVSDPESRLEKTYDWAHARRLELVKWLLTSAVALFAPVAVAVAKGELQSSASRGWLASTLFLSLTVAIAGISLLIRTQRHYRAYLAAQALLGELTKIAPFIERYRQQRPDR